MFHAQCRPQPRATSVEPLITLSQTKLNLLSHVLNTTSHDFPDLLRKGVLMQNALDWGMLEREREKKRKSEESIFPRPATRPAPPSRKAEHIMQILEVDEDAIVEGEEAWFEETWNELQASPERVQIEIFAVDEDDFSSDSSRSRSPSPTPLYMALPPTPKIHATKFDDKLETPMVASTLPPSLESGMPLDQVLALYDILDDDDEDFDLDVEAIEQTIELSIEDDVPGFDSDSDSDYEDSSVLATPTDDILDDFAISGSFEDDRYGSFDDLVGEKGANLFGGRGRLEETGLGAAGGLIGR